LAELQKISEDSTGVVELDQSRVGRLSRMDALQSQSISVETKRLRSMKLTAIEQTLSRIDDDDFGLCSECGEEIHEKRLEIDPAMRLCVSCAGNQV
jgi:DnaK suppressor protein